MELKLYNTLTRRREVFRPLDPKNVRMYVCGPTVYDYAHIGNARPVIVFDVLFRLLRQIYGPEHVTYVRNITDVDDKIIAAAKEEGVSIDEITQRTIKAFHEDVAALGCLPPTHEPRATEHIPKMITMIETLIAAGYAYPADGHVLFDVTKKDDYGKLSRRTADEMIAGARVEVAPYKKHPTDFVLWKPSAPDQPGWPSPWGRGRPGWHIECSAMGEALLGESFDIHGGGIDLVFPHHENEIAQSEAAHGGAPLARFWLHNGFLEVEGAKMSKSLGNFVTIRQLRQDWHWPPDVIRFNMLRTHYRDPQDWTLHGLKESLEILNQWYDVSTEDGQTILPEAAADALCDDLNTPRLIAEMHEMRRRRDLDSLQSTIRFLGLSGDKAKLVRSAGDKSIVVESGSLRFTGYAPTVIVRPSDQVIAAQISARDAARKAKNFAEADRIRKELEDKGILLKDTPEGTTWELKR